MKKPGYMFSSLLIMAVCIVCFYHSHVTANNKIKGTYLVKKSEEESQKVLFCQRILHYLLDQDLFMRFI